jgi:hypothetical protein
MLLYGNYVILFGRYQHVKVPIIKYYYYFEGFFISSVT